MSKTDHRRVVARLSKMLAWKADDFELDCRVASIVYHDPLVLTERITSEPEPDDERSPKEETWAMRAASLRLTKTIGLLLDAGVHPDDRGVFFDAPLIAFEGWYNNASRLKLALDRGAKPEVMRRETAWRQPRTFIARYHVEAISDMNTRDERSISESVTCLEMLLRAGATTVDARKANEDRRPTAAHLLASVNVSRVTDWALLQHIADLVPLLAAAGADLNRPEGPYTPAPVSFACAGKFGPMARALLRAGVKITDDYTLEARLQDRDSVTSTGHISRLLEQHFGDEGLSWLRERILRERIEQQLHQATDLAHLVDPQAHQVSSTTPSRRRRCL